MKSCHTQIIFAIGLVCALVAAVIGIIYAQMHSQPLDNTLNNICVSTISIMAAILHRPTSPTGAELPPPPGTTIKTETSETVTSATPPNKTN